MKNMPRRRWGNRGLMARGLGGSLKLRKNSRKRSRTAKSRSKSRSKSKSKMKSRSRSRSRKMRCPFRGYSQCKDGQNAGYCTRVKSQCKLNAELNGFKRFKCKRGGKGKLCSLAKRTNAMIKSKSRMKLRGGKRISKITPARQKELMKFAKSVVPDLAIFELAKPLPKKWVRRTKKRRK